MSTNTGDSTGEFELRQPPHTGNNSKQPATTIRTSGRMTTKPTSTDLPVAKYPGAINIEGIMEPIQCAVLDDGRSVLTQQGFLEALGRARAAKGGQGATQGGLPAFLAAKNLLPYVSDDLAKAAIPVRFRTLTGGRAYGYSAELLPKICVVYLKAREGDTNKKPVLRKEQLPIAARCDILIRGLATVGIVGLVHEATGYKYISSGNALQEILRSFIQEELIRWVKTFPNEFYDEIYRLREITPAEMSSRRPRYMGHITNDVIYERLAPGVLEELKRLEPPGEHGRRKNKLYWHLTKDIGHPKLQEHLSNVITLMKASTNWKTFYRLLERAKPKHKDVLAREQRKQLALAIEVPESDHWEE
jgi:hypothetical protein